MSALKFLDDSPRAWSVGSVHDGANASWWFAHAPKGYTHDKPLTIGGKQFVGGQFIPGKVLAKATPAELAKVQPMPLFDMEGGKGTQATRQPQKQSPAALSAAEDYRKNGTRAKAFKAWFGDWENEPEKASKVVNADGEPQETHNIPGTGSKVMKDGKPVVVYHGTAKGGFEAFDKSKLSRPEDLLYGAGFYFTEDGGVADEYAGKTRFTVTHFADKKMAEDALKRNREAMETRYGKSYHGLEFSVREFTENPKGDYRFGVVGVGYEKQEPKLARSLQADDFRKLGPIVDAARDEAAARNAAPDYVEWLGKLRESVGTAIGSDGKTITAYGGGVARFMARPSSVIPYATEHDDKLASQMREAVGVDIEQQMPERKAVYLNVRKPFDDDKGYAADPSHLRAVENLTDEQVRDIAYPGKDLDSKDPQSGVPYRSHVKAVRSQWKDKIYERIDSQEAARRHWGDEGVKSIDYNRLSREMGGHDGASKFLKALGYDGITHIGGHRMGGGHEHRVWIAFEPHQIKSVDNQGTFDPSNPSMKLAHDGLRAPKGHGFDNPLTINGKAFISGQWIPGADLAAASHTEKHDLRHSVEKSSYDLHALHGKNVVTQDGRIWKVQKEGRAWNVGKRKGLNEHQATEMLAKAGAKEPPELPYQDVDDDGKFVASVKEHMKRAAIQSSIAFDEDQAGDETAKDVSAIERASSLDELRAVLPRIAEWAIRKVERKEKRKGPEGKVGGESVGAEEKAEPTTFEQAGVLNRQAIDSVSQPSDDTTEPASSSAHVPSWKSTNWQPKLFDELPETQNLASGGTGRQGFLFGHDSNAWLNKIHRAPKGHTKDNPLTIDGRNFVGGEFIPAGFFQAATPEQRQEISRGTDEHNGELLHNHEPHQELMRKKLRSKYLDNLELMPSSYADAKKAWASLKYHHGDLTLHRLNQLIDEDLGQLKHEPDGSEHWQKLTGQLRAYRHMLDWAEDDMEGGKLRKSGVHIAHTKDLHVDPERFQYKINLQDKSTGTGEELKGVKEFNPDYAGTLLVWNDPQNGKDYVINGHHRHELASRANYPHLSIRYVKAKDDVEARSIGAAANIAEGRGTAVDAAKFMRDTGMTLEDMAKKGISPKGVVARDGSILAGLSPRLFTRLAIQMLDQKKALAVADEIKNHDDQELLFRKIEEIEQRRGEKHPLADHVVQEMARKVAQTPRVQSTEKDLFGDVADEKNLFEQVCQLQAWVRKQLSSDVTAFKAVGSTRREKQLSRGDNKLNVERNKQIAEQSDKMRLAYDKMVNLKGELSAAINKAAEEYYDEPKRLAEVQSRLWEEVREVLSGLIDGAEGQDTPGDSGGAQGGRGAQREHADEHRVAAEATRFSLSPVYDALRLELESRLRQFAHAPAGYTHDNPLVIQGRPFTGGQFIPANVMAQATPQERASVVDEVSASGDKHPADTATAAEEYKRLGTRSSHFKAWFGDFENDPAHASCVINEETGEPQETHPIPVYHGTTVQFDEFDPSLAGNHGLAAGKGFYFAENRAVAATYMQGTDTPTMHECYLNIRNPFAFDALYGRASREKIIEAAHLSGHEFDANQFEQRMREATRNKPEAQLAGQVVWQSLADALGGYQKGKSKVNEVLSLAGYDGVTHTTQDTAGTPSGPYAKFDYGRVWVAFTPTQIKSVDNRGTFDPANPNMRLGNP